MSAGHVMTGLSRSRTSTWKLHAAVLPLVSRAVQITMATPLLKLEPDGGEHETLAPGQLSLTLTLKLTIVLH